jgi:hypothetical protein
MTAVPSNADLEKASLEAFTRGLRMSPNVYRRRVTALHIEDEDRSSL